MTVLYADTSALVRAYLPDEPGHDDLRRALREGEDSVVTSQIASVEFARAIRAAARGGRHRDWRPIVRRFEQDAGPEGGVTLIALDPARVLPAARDLVLDHPVRTLDAIHLAVALQDGRELAGEDLVFVTRDRGQARAARKLGLAVS